MKKTFGFFASIFLGVFSSTMYAQQSELWTLEKCVAHALENNISIKQSELELQSVDIDKLEALGLFLPQISTSANYLINTGANVNPVTNQIVNQSFKSASANANLGINLYNGLSNWRSMQRAKLSKVASEYRLEKMKDDILLNVANAYLEILLNKEQIKVFQSQLELTIENENRTNQLIEAGNLPAGDLYEILASKASLEQQLVQAQNNFLISKLGLAQMLLIDDFYAFDIADEAIEVPLTSILSNSPQSIVEAAKDVVENIKIAELNKELAQKDVQLAKSAYHPRLSGFFGYSTRWSEDAPFPFADQIYLFDGTSIGLQLNVPILNGLSTRARVQRSKIAVDNADLQLKQATLDLERTVFQAYNDLVNAEKMYIASEKAVQARRNSNEFSRERFEVGLMNSFDYNQTLSQLETAESDFIRAKYNYIFRIKVLEFYFGLPIIK